MSITSDAMTLLDVRAGMRARILTAPCDEVLAIRLQEMGLTIGTEFQVIKVAPLGDPVEIEVRGYRLCLRKREAVGFEIEVVE